MSIKYTSNANNKWGLVSGESVEYDYTDSRTANTRARLQAFVGLLVILAVVIFLVVKF